MAAVDMVSKVYFGYNGYVENVEAYSNFPYALYASSISRCKEPSMTETIKQPTLIEDLGYLYATPTSKQKARYGTYLCECGAEFRVLSASVKNGHTRSCGCYKKQQTVERSTTHGLRNHKLFGVWAGIINRTSNPNTANFKRYGGRGISVCAEWRNEFKKFFDWCYENGYEKGLQIDRINNDGNYEPSNCRFVTNAVNSRNTRRIHSTNTSGYRGVSFNKSVKKWVANITINNKKKYLGCFSTALDAAAAYDTYIIKHGLEHTRNGVFL